MKLITFVTDTHLPLLERFFLPSFYRYPQAIESIQIYHMPQVLPIPAFGTGPYLEHSRAQAVLTWEYMKSCRAGDIVLSSDCDAQWFSSLEFIRDYHPEWDFAAQGENDGRMCGGFMRMRVTRQTLDMCQYVVEEMQDFTRGHATDALNRTFASGLIACGLFPLDRVWCTHHGWSVGQPVPEVPSTIVVQHASWVGGLENKLALLEAVRNKVHENTERRQRSG